MLRERERDLFPLHSPSSLGSERFYLGPVQFPFSLRPRSVGGVLHEKNDGDMFCNWEENLKGQTCAMFR